MIEDMLNAPREELSSPVRGSGRTDGTMANTSIIVSSQFVAFVTPKGSKCLYTGSFI